MATAAERQKSQATRLNLLLGRTEADTPPHCITILPSFFRLRCSRMRSTRYSVTLSHVTLSHVTLSQR
jgi:hypothetical protein